MAAEASLPHESWRERAQASPTMAPDGFVFPRFEPVTPAELRGGPRRRYPVAIVGAGMVGLSAAADLGSRGIDCLVLDDNDTVAGGSRAIGQARKSLQVWDRVGAAAAMQDKGLHWNFVRQLHGDKVVSHYELYPEPGNKFPPMMVLPQYYVESFLVQRCQALPAIELRWKNAVRQVRPRADHVELQVQTPEGSYQLQADWVLAADGVNSSVRNCLGLPFVGRKVEDRFVIVDVVVEDDFPPGRTFWFRPTFHDGRSTLFLRQPGRVCRVDFNIGPAADAQAEMQPQRLLPKLRAMFGTGKAFDIKWVSLYTVEVRRLARFRHGRVLFMGDAAHQLSPFGGGRGGNSGVEDADNLGWKLQRVINGHSPDSLLDSYDAERLPIADENIRLSLRAAEFISPSTPVSAVFQQAALTLSETLPFARDFLNSGRFSKTSRFADSPLGMADVDAEAFAQERSAPGCAALDAPVLFAGASHSLVERLGQDFCVMLYRPTLTSELISKLARLQDCGTPVKLLLVDAQGSGRRLSHMECVSDEQGLVRERYGLETGSLYLFRPDQRIVGRWRDANTAPLREALARACGLDRV